MADATASDVERHYRDLEKQLQEDGFSPDSQVMKTTRRLLRALGEDGFAFAGAKTEPEIEESEAKERTVTEETESEEAVVRAFRTRNEFDATVVTAVFASIDGWKTKIVEHKGSHFVIATNAKRLTDNRIKQAIVDYVQELKQAGQAG
jgi:hypothetical protein